MGGLSLLVVQRGPGVKTTKMDCMGVWGSGTTFVEFDDVKVPVGNLLGKVSFRFRSPPLAFRLSPLAAPYGRAPLS